MTFRIRGLDARQFSHLFTLSDAELAARGAVRKIADGPSPCRVSLTDATPGDDRRSARPISACSFRRARLLRGQGGTGMSGAPRQ